jgi:hypothetical protein
MMSDIAIFRQLTPIKEANSIHMIKPLVPTQNRDTRIIPGHKKAARLEAARHLGSCLFNLTGERATGASYDWYRPWTVHI